MRVGKFSEKGCGPRMKHSIVKKGAWTTIVHSHRGTKETKDLRGIIAIVDGRGCHNAAGCGMCVGFEACKGTKNVNSDTDSCQFRPTRFQHRIGMKGISVAV